MKCNTHMIDAPGTCPICDFQNSRKLSPSEKMFFDFGYNMNPEKTEFVPQKEWQRRMVGTGIKFKRLVKEKRDIPY